MFARLPPHRARHARCGSASLGRASRSRGSDRGSDRRFVRPTSATHKIHISTTNTLVRSTPSRISHATRALPVHAGSALRRSVVARAAFAPRARRTACLWRPGFALAASDRDEPRARLFARAASRSWARRVKRSCSEGRLGRLPLVPRLSRESSRERSRRASAVFQPTRGHLWRASDPRPRHRGQQRAAEASDP